MVWAHLQSQWKGKDYCRSFPELYRGRKNVIFSKCIFGRDFLSPRTTIDLIRGTIFDYVIHFRMAKAHERPYATVCKAVSEEA